MLDTRKDSGLFEVVVLTIRQNQSLDLLRAIDEEGLRYQIEYDIGGLLAREVWAKGEVLVLDLGALSRQLVSWLTSWCRRFRVPVIGVITLGMIDAQELWDDVTDVVVLPICPGELRFRSLRAITRINGFRSGDDKVIVVGDLKIDKERYEVSILDRKILLTYKEYQLLVLLASTPGRVYGRDSLLNQIWGYAYFGGTRTVDVHIRRLRSKIENTGHHFIETVRNVGYRFRA